MVFVPGVPGFPPGAFRRAVHKKSPAEARGTPGGMPSRVPCDAGSKLVRRPLRTVVLHGRRDGFRTRSPRVSTRGFPTRRPQKAPGGSRGTPGGMPSRVPCDAGSKLVSPCSRAAWTAGWFSGSKLVSPCSRAAWTAGWFSYPESPGFHPGLPDAPSTKSPRRKPGRMVPASVPALRRSERTHTARSPGWAGDPRPRPRHATYRARGWALSKASSSRLVVTWV